MNVHEFLSAEVLYEKKVRNKGCTPWSTITCPFLSEAMIMK